MVSNRTYPSTRALQVIVMIAEQGSTTASAKALNMTQSAVSKQLLALEDMAGAALFRRTPYGLSPTEAGRIYISEARTALGALENATLRIAALGSSPNAIKLHILPIMGDRWVIPRFASFAEAHPEIEVELSTFANSDLINQADAAFRFGEGDWEGQVQHYLFGRQVALVGAPGFIARLGGIVRPADIANFPLLDHRHTPLRWSEFAEAHALSSFEPGRITHFGYYALVIRAAIAGQGLALVPRGLIADEIAAGKLVNPGNFGFVSKHAYWLTYPQERPQRPAMLLFRDWLLAQVESMPPELR
ncbi:LysR substrate-binding domain-containing protein [Phyllobacterium sp. 0TCS1.6C]|uniref:LysR substrate-binding domain-containing protein n=1 Tax=unclassified Phyllobacterium TaxID=2638441 RepID=UPI002264D2DC|nr:MULTISPECIES: LysR substrate-binding domain-containing protein [unclassified Phyllobacterium]MCX8278706.1 LysR substrate-binding domain-containing protein [Phyllobacterium sp. 0TCS1.6C]MCX8293464.1 LysR substrate-binding domain-containing protein [Phyllobacterium sp. 0TCS1.6A]